MMLGEVAPGGTGSGLYGMLDPRGDHGVRRRADGRPNTGVPGQEDRRTRDQVRVAVPADHAAVVLVGTAIAMALPGERAGMLNPGAHGLSEVLYAFTSAANNNGSAFAGLTGQHRLVQHRARAGHAASAGSCRWCSCSAWPGRWPSRSRCPVTAGTLPTHRPLFVGMLVGVTVIVVALTYFPALALGPLAEGSTHEHHHCLPDSAAHRTGTRPSPPSAGRAGSAAGCSTRSSCGRRCPDALRKLDPRTLWRNPVMFIVEIGAVFTTVLAIARPQRVRLADHGLAVADRAVRQPGRGGRRGPRARRRRRRCAGPRPTRWPAPDRLAARRPGADRPEESVPAPRCGRATSSSSRPGRSSPATATSSRASPASTSRRSPASPPRSSANPAATGPRSPAAPRCSPTGSSCRSPRSRGRASSTG